MEAKECTLGCLWSRLQERPDSITKHHHVGTVVLAVYFTISKEWRVIIDPNNGRKAVDSRSLNFSTYEALYHGKERAVALQTLEVSRRILMM